MNDLEIRGKKYTLECPEGWRAPGWNRCILRDADGAPCCKQAADLWNGDDFQIRHETDVAEMLHYVHDCDVRWWPRAGDKAVPDPTHFFFAYASNEECTLEVFAEELTIVLKNEMDRGEAVDEV